MLKSIAILLLVFSSSFCAYSQSEGEGLPSDVNVRFVGGLNVGRAQLSNTSTTIDGVNHRMKIDTKGGFHVGAAFEYDIGDNIQIVPGLQVRFQNFNLIYESGFEDPTTFEVYPIALEIPLHFNFNVFNQTQNILVTFGARYTQNLSTNYHPDFTIKTNYISADFGLGKKIITEKYQITPLLIYSVGTENLLEYSNLPIFEQGTFNSLSLHQISLFVYI